MALVQDDCNGGSGLDAVSYQATLAGDAADDEGLSAIERVKGFNSGDILRGIDLPSLDAIVGGRNDALAFATIQAGGNIVINDISIY